MVDTLGQLTLNILSAKAPVATLDKEFAGVNAPPQSIKVSFTMFIPLFNGSEKPSLLPPVHDIAGQGKKCSLAIVKTDGTKLVSNGYLANINHTAGVGKSVEVSVEFCGELAGFQ